MFLDSQMPRFKQYIFFIFLLLLFIFDCCSFVLSISLFLYFSIFLLLDFLISLFLHFCISLFLYVWVPFSVYQFYTCIPFCCVRNHKPICPNWWWWSSLHTKSTQSYCLCVFSNVRESPKSSVLSVVWPAGKKGCGDVNYFRFYTLLLFIILWIFDNYVLIYNI